MICVMCLFLTPVLKGGIFSIHTRYPGSTTTGTYDVIEFFHTTTLLAIEEFHSVVVAHIDSDMKV
jgi:hypothetical protein